MTPFAKRVLPLIDLTKLTQEAMDDDIKSLCASAMRYHTAAVCVRPAFVPLACQQLESSSVRVATVINFPHDKDDNARIAHNTNSSTFVAEAMAALKAGAREIDLVFPYAAFMEGQEKQALDVIAATRNATEGTCLKVILETGAWGDSQALRAACDGAIDAGADFLKTSTGFYTTHATLDAVRILCDSSRALSKLVGVKVSGGISTEADAKSYLDLVESMMGLNWIEPSHFRFGTSRLLDALVNPALSPVGAY